MDIPHKNQYQKMYITKKGKYCLVFLKSVYNPYKPMLKYIKNHIKQCSGATSDSSDCLLFVDIRIHGLEPFLRFWICLYSLITLLFAE